MLKLVEGRQQESATFNNNSTYCEFVILSFPQLQDQEDTVNLEVLLHHSRSSHNLSRISLDSALRFKENARTVRFSVKEGRAA